MRNRLGAIVILITVALVAGCSGDQGSGGAAGSGGGGEESTGRSAAGAVSAPFTGADFYAVPDELADGEHGTLIRYQPIESDSTTSQSYRIMYTSESVASDPIAVTGVAVVPTAPAPSGGRRVLTIAHGTTGIADECAPSKHAQVGAALLESYVDAGYLISVTDYEGLGTPGRHPYLVGESEGRGVLDAARAAGQLPDADAGDKLAIFGYSQGGHGALWAGQLAGDWTPEFDLVGTVAGAPATEIPVIFGAAQRLPIAGFLYMIIAGFNAAYPDEARLDEVLTPAGEKELDTVDKGCGGEVVGHFTGKKAADLLQPDVGTVQPWAKLAEENNPGNVATDTPILILHSAADDVVPAALSGIMVDRMCKEGQVVERRVYNEGLGHGAQAPEAFRDGFTWIQQRFAGDRPKSTCPSG
jgi:pimeloyl-ACP methyl ester carboxylesterase